MITRIMLEHLKELKERERQGRKLRIEDYVYMKRIQKRIDNELDMAFKLAKNYPEVFLDMVRAKNEYGHVWGCRVGNIHAKKEERLRKLLLIIKCLTKAEPEFVKKVEKHD